MIKKDKKDKKTKKEKSSKKVSLFAMLIMLSVLPMVLSVAIISTMSLFITKNNMEKETESALYIVANNLANYCYENEITAINASNYYEYLDSLKEQGIEMAIVIDGAPCATSIKNENDYRIREIEFEKDIVADKAEIENGYYDKYVLIDEKVYYAYYMPIRSEGEIIGMAFAGKLQESVTGATKNIIFLFVGVAVCLLLIFVIVGLLFSRGLLKTFKTVGKSVDALSQGDLSERKARNSVVKEMHILMEETTAMQKNLAETIGKVKDVSQRLVENILEVTKLSESSSDRAKQITSAVDELTVATTGTAENVHDISSEMMEIGNCINDISGSVEHLYNSSENILQTNNEAQKNMNTIMENTKESVNAVNDIAVQIKQTNDSIKEIDTAVELILAISEQTSLLSLNASIEAARAGEHGKGFAVVAEEIRSLSDQSADGAEMIKKLAQTITDKSKKSVQLTERVHSLILLEQENVSKTQEKYEELSGEINQSVIEIKSIAEKTENLTNYKENIIGNIHDLSALSEENAASNQEVNANISEIISEVQMVNENCEKISCMAKELEEAVSYFHDGQN